MIFHYAGKYSGNEEDLPQREHPEGYVPFREFQNMVLFSIVANILALVLAMIPLMYCMFHGGFSGLGCILSLVCMFPHEVLHAIWFKKDVYMYNNLNKGLLFVAGTEDMSKTRFILMSLCPNIVFGFLPFLLFLFFPQIRFLGTMGALSIGMGAGDYINVYNAATQMPKGAKTYLCGMHSYWYKPNINEKEVVNHDH